MSEQKQPEPQPARQTIPHPNAPVMPTAPPPAPPTSTSASDTAPAIDRKPVRGEWVWWRDHDGDRPAIVAEVRKDGTLTLAILNGGGSWMTRDQVARDRTDPDKGGIKIQGMWRFKD